MSRTISPSALSSHSAHIWGSEEDRGQLCGLLIATRDSGALRPSLYIRWTRTEREGVAPSHARDASIYRCDAGRGASRRGAGASRRETGRFMSRRLAPWQAAQRRAGLGEHRRCTGRGLGSDAEYRSALRVDPRRRPLILLFVLDLMLLGRCSVDDLSLALGLHARLS